MPKIPWSHITSVDPDTEVTLMASRLPLRSYAHIPRFLRTTTRVRKQLAHADGLVGYALDAQLFKKTFWTVSAWTTRDALHRFDRADPHHATTELIRPLMQQSTFVFWTGKARDVPINWSEARQRIDARREDIASAE